MSLFSNYEILSHNSIGYFRVVDLESKIEYSAKYLFFNTKNRDDYIKFTKLVDAEKNMDLFNLNIKNKFTIDVKEFKKNILDRKIKNSFDQEDEYDQIFIVIYTYKNTKKLNKLDKYGLFELYYNLLKLRFNYNISLNQISFFQKVIISEKYNKSSSYLICDDLFTTPIIENRLILNLDQIHNYRLIAEFEENIKNIKNDILDIDELFTENFFSDKETLQLYEYISKKKCQQLMSYYF